jgi:hypothetical protein
LRAGEGETKYARKFKEAFDKLLQTQRDKLVKTQRGQRLNNTVFLSPPKISTLACGLISWRH